MSNDAMVSCLYKKDLYLIANIITMFIYNNAIVSSVHSHDVENCPVYRFDQSRRVKRGTPLQTYITVPADTTNVKWHTTSVPCFPQTIVFANCAVKADSEPTCNNSKGGYLMRMSPWSSRNNGSDFPPIGIFDSSQKINESDNPTKPASDDYVLRLKIDGADAEFESPGSTITCTRKGGKIMSIRAFRPHMVYTSAQGLSHKCKNITIGTENYWYHEIRATEVYPEMECLLKKKVKGTDVKFSIEYQENKNSFLPLSATCTCLIPFADDESRKHPELVRWTFMVRAKTQGISSIKEPNLGKGRSFNTAHNEPWFGDDSIFNDKENKMDTGVNNKGDFVKMDGDTLIIPKPEDKYIEYPDTEEGEPDPWKEIKVRTSNCVKESNDSKGDGGTTGISGLLALDPASCPLYLTDGSVAKCRCYMSSKAQLYWTSVIARWSHEDVEDRFITDTYNESYVLVYKFKGQTRSYHCEARDTDNKVVEKITYTIEDLHSKWNGMSKPFVAELWFIKLGVLFHIVLFGGTCFWSILKKSGRRYHQDIDKTIAGYIKAKPEGTENIKSEK